MGPLPFEDGIPSPSPACEVLTRSMTSLSKTGIPGPDMAMASELSQYWGGHSARRIRSAGSVLELDDILHANRKVRAWQAAMHIGDQANMCGHLMQAPC